MNLLKTFHYAYVIIFCCCMIMGVIIGLVMSCAGIYYVPVSNELGVSKADFGLYMTFVYAFSFFMLSVAGRMMDRFSVRWILTLSSAMIGLTYLAMSQFNHIWQFYISGGVLGIALSFLLYLSYPVLINRWFISGISFYIGLCSAASGIGGVLFNLLIGHYIEIYGWRTAYLISGLLILVVVTPLLGFLLRDYPADKGLNPYGKTNIINKKPETGIMYHTAIQSKAFYLIFLFAFLMIAVSSLNLFIPAYVISIGYSLKQSTQAASSIMLGVTLGKIILGYLNDKSVILGIFLSISLGILGLVILILSKDIVEMMLTGAFLFGWAYAGVTVETAILVRSVFGSKEYAKIFSHISISLALGGTIMSGAWGYLAETIGFKILLGVGISCLLLSGILGWHALSYKKF
ncbi:MFS transporter [Apibacter sp. HY039]|uniref:MFS transporter n=1 Tax=Apibacter sp. HY039 TaxID=2501476 RepID=UPI0013E3682C|nr:MFS transporter [Apibacter sp. HY039]